MLRAAKLAALRAARRMGAYALLRGSQWRAQRLLILCYHGISLADEHAGIRSYTFQAICSSSD